MTSIVVVYDLSPFIEANRQFLEELKTAAGSGSLSIARIFEILPLNVVRPYDGQRQLEGRGGGSFVKDGSTFSNYSNTSQLITFLDDQLDEIAVSFPPAIRVSISESGASVTVRSVGDLIKIDFKVLPGDLQIIEPLAFHNFTVSPERMVTTFVDRAGNEIIVDGGVDKWSREKRRLMGLLKAFREGGEGRCPDPTEPPEENWNYAIYRNANNGYCRVITPGMEWGNVRLGIYDTQGEAERAMQEFLTDGESPGNIGPTCEGRG